MLLSVIIVNYNVKYFLEYCLCSVEKAIKNLEGEIFVVDNNSTDGSKEFFYNKFPRVNFIWNKENEGFAKANNKALKQCSGAYILFLNPDTIIPEDALEKCISFIQSRNDNIACGVKMIDGSGKFLKESKRAFPSPATSLYKLTGLAKLFPGSKIFSKYHLGFLNKNETHEIDVLAGAFMMVPKKILNNVGGFDESFFMYGEDIDLSYRIQQAGFKNYYFSKIAIIHFKGESTRRESFTYVKFFYKAMIIFVRKHYGGTKAGIFNFFIQVAIFFRALLAIVARFLKWIGLPVIDAGIILASFYIVKLLWSTFIKREVNYSPNMLIIAFPAFTILFLAASYFAGLYDGSFRQSRLNKSTITAIIILLAAYSLLPETLRFSRGILFFGSVAAFILMTAVRWLLLKWKIIDSEAAREEINQTVIAGSQNDFEEVCGLLENAGMKERISGRIEPGKIPMPNTIGTLDNIAALLRSYPVKEIIFCEGALSFKEIIEVLPEISGKIRIKIYAKATLFLIGSAGKDAPGTYVSGDTGYRLNQIISRRNKTLSDIIIAMFFIITFPLHLIIKSKPLHFFKNVFIVLLQKKTWIGYAACQKKLLPLKAGILTTTGLPAALNTLPQENLLLSDRVYAKNFHILNDIKIVWLNYKLLSF